MVAPSDMVIVSIVPVILESSSVGPNARPIPSFPRRRDPIVAARAMKAPGPEVMDPRLRGDDGEGEVGPSSHLSMTKQSQTDRGNPPAGLPIREPDATRAASHERCFRALFPHGTATFSVSGED